MAPASNSRFLLSLLLPAFLLLFLRLLLLLLRWLLPLLRLRRLLLPSLTTTTT